MAFFDPTRASYRANPYPALAALRREDPVHWSAQLHAWVPTRYGECATVLHDTRRFTSDPVGMAGARAAAILAHRAAVPLGEVPNLGTTTGAIHRHLRAVVNPVFTAAAVRLRSAAIAVEVGRLIEEIPEGIPFDFMEMVAGPLPRRAMVAVIGCPPADSEGLQRALLAIEMTRSNPNPSAALVAAARDGESTADGILRPHLEGSLAPSTVLGALMPLGPASRTVAEVTSLLAQIATVGAEPTTAGLGNAVLALARHPEACAALRREPSLIHNAVHELLRFDSPTHIIPRFASVECELAGKHIHPGDTILVVAGAGNRDPEAFANPDALDCRRDARRELAFGQGEHICLGAPLALALLEAAVTALFKRFSHIDLASEPEYGPAIQLRRPNRLMLRCS